MGVLLRTRRNWGTVLPVEIIHLLVGGRTGCSERECRVGHDDLRGRHIAGRRRQSWLDEDPDAAERGTRGIARVSKLIGAGI